MIQSKIISRSNNKTWFDKLPLACLNLIYEYDSTYSNIFLEQVLKIKKNIQNEWVKEFPFYKEVIEQKYFGKNNNYPFEFFKGLNKMHDSSNKIQYMRGIMMQTLIALIPCKEYHLPFAHELQVKYNRCIFNNRELQKLSVQYEIDTHWFVVWHNCPVSLEEFMIYYMEFTSKRKRIDFIAVSSFLKKNEFKLHKSDSRISGYEKVHKFMESIAYQEPYNSESKHVKMYIDRIDSDYYLKLYLIEGKIIIYIDFDYQ